MKEQIEFFLELLPNLTEEESQQILNVINWPPERQVAYKLAKSIFDSHLKEKSPEEHV